jgi:hypothetical protein
MHDNLCQQWLPAVLSGCQLCSVAVCMIAAVVGGHSHIAAPVGVTWVVPQAVLPCVLVLARLCNKL